MDTGQPYCLKMRIEAHRLHFLRSRLDDRNERIESAQSGENGSRAVRTRTRLDAQVRSKMIVEAAFKAIAEEGFEGLRTRDIAKSVGINSATLHRHFPKKEDLIAAVADYLQHRFRAEDTQAVEGESAMDALEHQLKDAIFYYRHRPEMLAVYREFVGRAPRDPAIRKLLRRLHESWNAQVAGTIQRGIRDGTFRADLNPEAAASVIICTVWGLLAQVFYSIEAFDAGFREVLMWIAVGQINKRRKDSGHRNGSTMRGSSNR
jgi:AcrR family transcriptional regulator